MPSTHHLELIYSMGIAKTCVEYNARPVSGGMKAEHFVWVVVCQVLRMTKHDVSPVVYLSQTGVLLLLSHSLNLTYPLTTPQTGGFMSSLTHLNQK